MEEHVETPYRFHFGGGYYGIQTIADFIVLPDCTILRCDGWTSGQSPHPINLRTVECAEIMSVAYDEAHNRSGVVSLAPARALEFELPELE